MQHNVFSCTLFLWLSEITRSYSTLEQALSVKAAEESSRDLGWSVLLELNSPILIRKFLIDHQ